MIRTTTALLLLAAATCTPSLPLALALLGSGLAVAAGIKNR